MTPLHCKDSRDFHQNEVRKIVSVTSNTVRSTVKLDQKLNHAHWASPDYQVSVTKPAIQALIIYSGVVLEVVNVRTSFFVLALVTVPTFSQTLAIVLDSNDASDTPCGVCTRLPPDGKRCLTLQHEGRGWPPLSGNRCRRAQAELGANRCDASRCKLVLVGQLPASCQVPYRIRWPHLCDGQRHRTAVVC